jgi:RimJ/RimL family protein N-acetyltransferase
MRHSLQGEGFGVRFRPVREEDAAFIVWLRNLDHAKGNIGDSAFDVTGQKAWLNAYFEREGDYYFIVETLTGIPVGTYGIYDISGNTAESGRWVIRPGAPAAPPSAIVGLDLVFNTLGITQLHGTTVASNRPVLSLNRKMGYKQIRIERAARIIGNRAVDMVHLALSAADWREARERLLPVARLAEAQIRDWERAERQVVRPHDPWRTPN